MLEFIKKNKWIILLILVFISLLIFYFVRDYISNKRFRENKSIEYKSVPKVYGVNEYISVVMSDEDMARIYLNSYINKMVTNTEEAFYLLDEEYRNLKFGSLNNYVDYVYSLRYSSYNVASYFKKELDDYTIYGVYDQYDNFYAFKVKGVMQYSVYLDNYTVEIW